MSACGETFTSDDPWDQARALLARGPAQLVTVSAVRGSAPREPGAWMIVSADTVLGTIGGGHLEWQAIGRARERLTRGEMPAERLRWVLGARLGQCCGGTVELTLQAADAAALDALRSNEERHRAPVAVFGAGHVGRAIVRALQPLPFRVQWFDSRADALTGPLPANVQAEHSDPIARAVPTLPAGCRVLVLTHSHAEDFELIDACLQRLRAQDDLPFVGLIGSRTKWASFRSRLLARGHPPALLARVVCPIGLPGIPGKAPAVIAAAVAAQLLQLR